MNYTAKVLEEFTNNPIATDYKLVSVKGVLQNPTFDVQKFESLIDSFQTFEDDIFISTFVKAGAIFLSIYCESC